MRAETYVKLGTMYFKAISSQNYYHRASACARASRAYALARMLKMVVMKVIMAHLDLFKLGRDVGRG